MPGRQGFITNGETYVYQETPDSKSAALGIDGSDFKWKLKVLTTVNAVPNGVCQMTVDPTVNGNITFVPNGLGNVTISNGGLTATGGLRVLTGATVITPLAAARPCTVRSSPSGQLSTLIDSNVNGQVLISSAVGTPIWSSLTAGAGIALTPGANSITITSTGGGVAWNSVPGAVVALAADNGYMLNNVGPTTCTLPVACAVGASIILVGMGGLFVVAQAAGQRIIMGNTLSTVGVTGSLASTSQYDVIELICSVANTTFIALSSVGNFTIS